MPNEQNQKAIAAILKELDLPLDFNSKDDRLAIQKSIYLSQVAGANLSYWFNWYLNGPYSSALADDYYEAKSKLADLERFSAAEGLRQKLQSVKALLARKPEGVDNPRWLEALASLHYMRRVQRRPANAVVDECAAEKPHLEPMLNEALAALRSNGFLE